MQRRDEESSAESLEELAAELTKTSQEVSATSKQMVELGIQHSSTLAKHEEMMSSAASAQCDVEGREEDASKATEIEREKKLAKAFYEAHARKVDQQPLTLKTNDAAWRLQLAETFLCLLKLFFHRLLLGSDCAQC